MVGEHTLILTDSHQYKLDGRRIVGTTTFVKGSLPTSRGLIQWEMKNALEEGWKLGQGNIILTEETIKDSIKNATEAGKKKSAEAAAVGSSVHKYAEVFEKENPEAAEKLKEEFKELPNSDKILKGIDGFLKWKEGRKAKPLMTEQILAYVCFKHRADSDNGAICHCYGGMLDRLEEVDGELTISDYKTSGGIYWDMFVQQGAYANALYYWFCQVATRLEIVRFDKETGETESIYVDSAAPMLQAVRCRETYEFQKGIQKQLLGDVWTKE